MKYFQDDMKVVLSNGKQVYVDCECSITKENISCIPSVINADPYYCSPEEAECRSYVDEWNYVVLWDENDNEVELTKSEQEELDQRIYDWAESYI